MFLINKYFPPFSSPSFLSSLKKDILLLQMFSFVLSPFFFSSADVIFSLFKYFLLFPFHSFSLESSKYQISGSETRINQCVDLSWSFGVVKECNNVPFWIFDVVKQWINNRITYLCSSLECDNAHRASYFCPDVDNARYCYFHQMGILLKVISRMWSLHNIDELKKCQSRPLLVLKKLNLKEHVEIWNS